MSTCNACGISAWHPEARTCVMPDCALRQPTQLTPSAGCDPRSGAPGSTPPSGRVPVPAAAHAAAGTVVEIGDRSVAVGPGYPLPATADHQELAA